MFEQAFATVFANAATPQKFALIALVGAIPMIAIAAALAYREAQINGPWARIISALRFAGPMSGLIVGAMNSFHMAQTILRVPFTPTAKQLAPGILEISTLIGLGALVGIVALAAHYTLVFIRERRTA